MEHRMGLWELITGKPKGLLDLSRSELRQQELLLTKHRDQLMSRIERLAKDKQDIFARGAASKSPEMRRALAMEFEARTQEQLLYARQLNIKSKELLTATRVRLAKENTETASKLGLGRITEGDMLRLAKMIETDAISSEMYAQRLDELLGAASEADRAAIGEPTDAAASLMNVWAQMDNGDLREEQGFETADAQVRARAAKSIAEE
jgi:hypothetical protein